MGRHSAAPRDNSPQLRRLGRNSLAVMIATLATMLVVMVSIASFAAFKDNEIPLPTMAVDDTGAYVPIPHANADSGPIPEPTVTDGSPDGSTMRQCPATGCSAPTCHAETGEPIPHF